MNPTRRLALIHAAELARKRKQRVAHIQRELNWETNELIKFEINAETRAFWPTPIISVSAALAAGIVLILWQAGVI